MPIITIRETYDLSTAPGRLGLIGIHTPGSSIIRKLYPGLWLNYNKVKVNSCNVALACASLLPADPLQIGVETGDIAPQDLFNPILYRACSTDSFNTILNRMYGTDSLFKLQDGSIAFDSNGPGDPFPSASDLNSENAYYGLLSESGWKKAMPQSGLQMRHLVPLVYNVISNYGNAANIEYPPDSSDSIRLAQIPNAGGASGTTAVRTASIFRGHSFPMPAIPTARGMVMGMASYVDSTSTQADVDNSWYFPYFPPALIPKTYVGCIIIPPSKLHKLYFRMTISWSVSFFDPVSIVERGRITEMSEAGIQTYGLGFQMGDQSKEIENKMTSVESTVDTLDVDANMIMQS